MIKGADEDELEEKEHEEDERVQVAPNMEAGDGPRRARREKEEMGGM